MPRSRSTRWKQRTEHANREHFGFLEKSRFEKELECEHSHGAEPHASTGSPLEILVAFIFIVGVIVCSVFALAAVHKKTSDSQQSQQPQIATALPVH